VLRAVLFDWGDTLMQWTFDPELLVAGHRAGLEAIGRDDDGITERFRETYVPMMFETGAIEEIEYPGLVRSLLAESGIDELYRSSVRACIADFAIDHLTARQTFGDAFALALPSSPA